MDFGHFQEFMLESAARHEVEIAAIRESLGSMTNTVDRLVDNQIHLQESIDVLSREMRALERVVFRHVTDPDAHRPN
jgi:hypothetical protein